MAQPTGSDLYVSIPLTNLSVAYIQDNQEFIADQVFPSVPVAARTGLYWKYAKGDWFRTAAQKRAPRTESAGTGWNMERDTYLVDVNAVHVDVADQDRADQANQERSVLDLDRDATRFVIRDILLRREKDWVEAFFTPGVWTNVAQIGVASGVGAGEFLQWNDSDSTPIQDIENMRVAFGENTGFRPNVLVIGARVYSAFKNHPEFIERIKYSQKGIVTLDLIAALLDVPKVLTPMVIENVGEEQAPDDFQYIYGKSALLAYAAPNAGIMQPSAGYTFEWTGYLGSNVRGTSTSKFRLQELKADRIETESAYGFKVISPDLGVFYTTAVA